MDTEPTPQQTKYKTLSEEDWQIGRIRPYRDTYRHLTCGKTTTMGSAIAETYARRPDYYNGTYCVDCRMHRPLEEFVWLDDGSTVGT